MHGNYSHTWAQATYNDLGTPNGAPRAGAINLSSTNPFLPAQRSRRGWRRPAPLSASQDFTDIPATNVDTWVRQGQATAGLNGKFGNGYEWDVELFERRGMQNTRQNGNINNLKMPAALNARHQSGQRPDRVRGEPDGQCRPVSRLRADERLRTQLRESRSIDYVMGVTEFRAYTTLDDFNASVTGSPFSTWAGPVNMALSAEWRKLGYHLDSSLGCRTMPAIRSAARACRPTAARRMSPRRPGRRRSRRLARWSARA